MDLLFIIYILFPIGFLIFGYWFGYTRGENEGYLFGKEVGRYEERASRVMFFGDDDDTGGIEHL